MVKKKAESNWIKQCCIRMSQCLIEATKNGHIDKWVHWLMKAASLCNSCRELHNVVCWPLFSASIFHFGIISWWCLNTELLQQLRSTVLHGQAQKRCDHRFIGIARGRKGLLLPLLNLKIFARKIGKKDDCHYLYYIREGSLKTNLPSTWGATF